MAVEEVNEGKGKQEVHCPEKGPHREAIEKLESGTELSAIWDCQAVAKKEVVALKSHKFHEGNEVSPKHHHYIEEAQAIKIEKPLPATNLLDSLRSSEIVVALLVSFFMATN